MKLSDPAPQLLLFPSLLPSMALGSSASSSSARLGQRAPRGTTPLLPSQCHPSGCITDLFIQMAIIMILKQTISNVMEYLIP